MGRSIGQIKTKVKVVMVLTKKISKRVTASIPLLLEIKVKKKIQNSRNISGN